MVIISKHDFLVKWSEAKSEDERILLVFLGRKKGYSFSTLSELTGWHEYNLWYVIHKQVLEGELMLAQEIAIVLEVKKVEQICKFIRKAPEFDCHFWTGATDENLRAIFYLDGKMKLVVEYIWELQNGKIPEGWSLEPICDTPDCVNLDHYALEQFV
jgi:hypothetical protein